MGMKALFHDRLIPNGLMRDFRRSLLVGQHHQLYLGLGADIVMDSISFQAIAWSPACWVMRGKRHSGRVINRKSFVTKC